MALPTDTARVLIFLRFGVIAQLVERLNGIEEVWGSNPHGSISPKRPGGGAGLRAAG